MVGDGVGQRVERGAVRSEFRSHVDPGIAQSVGCGPEPVVNILRSASQEQRHADLRPGQSGKTKILSPTMVPMPMASPPGS